MFDKLDIKLNTKFMKGIVSKLIAKVVYKETGYKVDIQLNEIQIEVINGEAHIHVDVDGKIDSKELVRIVKENGLD